MTATIDRARNAIYGTFVGDAASVGLHWIYDVAEVAEVASRAGSDAAFHAPADNQYHSRRKPGEFTHYGDAAFVMLESLVAQGDLDTKDYRQRYVDRFGAADYDGYLDHATKALLKDGRGAADEHAGCLAPLPTLVARFLEDKELLERVEAAVRVTHDSDRAAAYARGAAVAIKAALQGATPGGAVAAVVERGGAVGEAAQAALRADADVVAFALEVGQVCPVASSVPVALHAALHGPDFKAAVRQSILSGGDSAGRLLLTGAIRGATDGVPEDWLGRVAARIRLEELAGTLLDQASIG